MKLKNYFILLMTVLVGGLTMNACSLDDDNDYVYAPAAVAQFVNAYPYAEALGFRMDQSVINIEGPVDYGKYLRYDYLRQFYVGERHFSAGISGTDQPLVDTLVTLQDSMEYTAIVYGLNDTAASIFVEDKRPDNFDQGKAYVRFFNVADHAPAMNVNLINGSTSSPIISNRSQDNQISAKANQGFIGVDPGLYTIQFTDANGTELAKRDKAEEFNAGRFYTIISKGNVGGTEKPLTVGYVKHSGE